MVSADTDLWFLHIYIFGLKENRKMAYVFVTGDVKVTAQITVEHFIKKMLWWTGFPIE